jgi:triacylglycerol lipase
MKGNMKLTLSRCSLILNLAALLLGACANAPQQIDTDHPPIVFVHGNGDSAALWMTTIWRFESNGWPHERLFALDLPYPNMRAADDKAQEGHTSSAEHMQFLAAQVEQFRRATGVDKVVLMGNSRGGYAIRNYTKNGGGAEKVSHAILGSTPNHGWFASTEYRPTRESNALGPLLSGLNIPQGPNGEEVTPGIKWMTIRSDTNDWAAQPVWLWGPLKGKSTGVSYDSPALKGAENVVLPGIDHCEASFSPLAFAQAFRFITGRAPGTMEVTPQSRVVLSGKVFGLGMNNDPATGDFENNLPLVGATVDVYKLNQASGERVGAPLLSQSVSSDGRWGPIDSDSTSALEFVITETKYPVTHIYRSPFARSSDIVHLQARVFAKDDEQAGAVVIMSRPRGFFTVLRDKISFDGISPPPGIGPGAASENSSTLRLDGAVVRPISAQLNDERVTGRTWTKRENHLVVLELQGGFKSEAQQF